MNYPLFRDSCIPSMTFDLDRIAQAMIGKLGVVLFEGFEVFCEKAEARNLSWRDEVLAPAQDRRGSKADATSPFVGGT
ncbi:hypothetical protein IEQ11_12785 [Lysobacter capsici]|uniref:hypothetical protein n=1 Tax=Lysobacter capsici TaxID=435897 RepID=UPI0017805090|nr:hypothetical protein [Lysobacter capsici]UOF12649.1 hypothetical protein IEQ11_12785 [Lysobacter capsici]